MGQLVKRTLVFGRSGPVPPQLLLILDDDPARLSGFEGILPELGSDWRVKAWCHAEAMIAELEDFLPEAHFISLDAALASPVANHLANRKPTCPITVHWRNRTSDVAWRFFKHLSSAGWHVELVRHFDYDWHRMIWLPVAQKLLHARTDTKANRVHAANCERIRTQFEGREAIYIEKFVRRVKVWHIRANVDARYVEAMAEEILTPGLGAPGVYGLRPRWRFGGGYPSRFSRDSWSVAAQHVAWQLYFAQDVVDAVVGFAATLPSEEVYHSDRMMKLIWERTAKSARNEERVFPG